MLDNKHERSRNLDKQPHVTNLNQGHMRHNAPECTALVSKKNLSICMFLVLMFCIALFWCLLFKCKLLRIGCLDWGEWVFFVIYWSWCFFLFEAVVLFLSVLGIGYVILSLHSLSLVHSWFKH